MRKLLLLAVLVAAVACGSYRFPGQPSGSGHLSGQVTTVGCGMVPTAKMLCVPPVVPNPAACPTDATGRSSCGTLPAPAVMCPPDTSGGNSCGPIYKPGYPCQADAVPPYPCGGSVPVPGLELVFTSASSTASTTTDSNGNYSIELAAGSWKVSTKNFMQIVGGPTTVTITAGANIVANYTVWSRIAYLSS